MKKPKTTTELLLCDIDDTQWLLLARLADEALERGDRVWAQGWRWLADNRRWPLAATEEVVREVMPKVIGEATHVVEVVTLWEWWRAREGRTYSCSLPKLLMDHVRRAGHAKYRATCAFKTPGAALACAAFQAGNLIALFGSVEEPARTTNQFQNLSEDQS